MLTHYLFVYFLLTHINYDGILKRFLIDFKHILPINSVARFMKQPLLFLFIVLV